MSAPKIDEMRAYLPVDAVVRDGKPQIEWLKLNSVEFGEPFFHDTVARVRQQKPHLQPIFTDLEALLMDHAASSRQPSALIFHTSRCGSTVVANACRALDRSHVIAEPKVVDKLVSRLFTDAAVGSSKELLYLTLIRAAIGLLGTNETDARGPYVVKFACPSLLQIKLLRRIWPGVPVLILYRHPLEVAVSNLRNLPEWINVNSNPDAAAAIAGVATRDLEGMTSEEFCSRALGRYYAATESVADETSTMIIEYKQLSVETIRRILEFFGVNPSESEIVKIEDSMRLYSKDSSRAFQPDSADKKAGASPKTIEMVEKWAMPAYVRLLERSIKSEL